MGQGSILKGGRGVREEVMARNNKRLLVVFGAFAVAAGLLAAAAWLLGDPLREYLLARTNKGLKGYTVTAQDLSLHPLALSFVFKDLRMVQQHHRSPPVIAIPAATVRVSLKAMIQGRIVTDIHLANPEVTLDLNHIRTEAKDDVLLKNKGLQHTRRISPFDINLLSVEKGKFSYIEKGGQEPLTLNDIRFIARNIRQIQNSKDPYPSTVNLSSRVFGEGRIDFNGHADFLAQPRPALKGHLTVDNLPLAPLGPVVNRTRLSIQAGRIESLKAFFEYSTKTKQIDIAEAHVDGLKSSYKYPVKVYPAVSKAISKTKSVTTEKKAAPDQLKLRIGKLVLTSGDIGFINLKSDPEYRLFLSSIRLRVENYSNGFENGPAAVRLRGRFMGSGDVAVYGTFRPEKNGPDFDLRVAIENTPVTAMNKLLQAYAKLDVAAGWFSLYSEVAVHDRYIYGYVKPLLRDVKVQSQNQDENDNLFQQIYEGVVDVLAKMLERTPQDVVATKTDLAGKIDNPRADTLEALINLIRNAFFKAVVPGFTQRWPSAKG